MEAKIFQKKARQAPRKGGCPGSKRSGIVKSNKSLLYISFPIFEANKTLSQNIPKSYDKEKNNNPKAMLISNLLNVLFWYVKTIIFNSIYSSLLRVQSKNLNLLLNAWIMQNYFFKKILCTHSILIICSIFVLSKSK